MVIADCWLEIPIRTCSNIDKYFQAFLPVWAATSLECTARDEQTPAESERT
jgi:hypothetical protein